MIKNFKLKFKLGNDSQICIFWRILQQLMVRWVLPDRWEALAKFTQELMRTQQLYLRQSREDSLRKSLGGQICFQDAHAGHTYCLTNCSQTICVTYSRTLLRSCFKFNGYRFWILISFPLWIIDTWVHFQSLTVLKDSTELQLQLLSGSWTQQSPSDLLAFKHSTFSQRGLTS